MEMPITLIVMNENRLVYDEYIEKPTKKYRQHEMIYIHGNVRCIVTDVRATFVLCRVITP